MTRKQANLLNALGVACAAIIFSNLVLAAMNGSLNNKLAEAQSQMQRTQSVQNTMNKLVGLSMQTAERDPAIKRLLIKHRFILPDPVAASPAKR